jgi:large subunit ribosomal protein L3
VRTPERDGYAAVQLGFLASKKSRLTKPMEGFFSALKVSPVRILREFRLHGDAAPEADEVEVGNEVTVGAFQETTLVDVRGTTKGKGFAGTVKRWHFARGPMTHGSKSHRQPASTGGTDAARVFKGKRSPGHMGAKTVSTRGLQLVRVDPERGLLFVKGAVPGPDGGILEVRPSRRKR